MLTVVSPRVELLSRDSPDGPRLMDTRALFSRTVRGGSPSSTSPAVSMTWPVPGPCRELPPFPRSLATRRTWSWRRLPRSWQVWGLFAVTMFTWPIFPAGEVELIKIKDFFCIDWLRSYCILLTGTEMRGLPPENQRSTENLTPVFINPAYQVK